MSKSPTRKFTLLITSGCRPELFRETIESFVQCCCDLSLIDRWICIDDGTDEKSRDLHRGLYPWIEFIYKDPANVGHAKSLNQVSSLLQTEYIVRLEDDWKFISTGHFIRDAIEILDEMPDVGQVMLNKNYQQRQTDNLTGGIEAKTSSGKPFYYHLYLDKPEEQAEWYKNNSPSVLVSWPHFSLQPSVTRLVCLEKPFNENSSYFEYEYAKEYTADGWKTAFLPGFVCEHTGRLLNDYSGPLNAYEMLGQKHFGRSPRHYDKTDTRRPY